MPPNKVVLRGGADPARRDDGEKVGESFNFRVREIATKRMSQTSCPLDVE